MSDTSLRLGLPYLQPSQAQKHVTHNTALHLLDALVQLSVTTFDAQTPPPAPEQGEIFALGSNPTGEWAGQAGKMAMRDGTAWHFITPQDGWRAWDLTRGRLRVFAAESWQDVTQDLQQLDGLGINTASDATNRLALASSASLFTHEGAGHQIKVNKATQGDTASLLFQSDWQGHAEMGLAGNLSFSIKVSPDGTAWHNALAIDPVSQTVALAPAGTTRAELSDSALTLDVPLEGTAVQTGPQDTTAGRLMLAQHGVLREDMVGFVSQSGGMPTGAVIETGTNANGHYTRWADGTQMCWTQHTSGSIWSFPANFAGSAADRIIQVTPTGNNALTATSGVNLANASTPRAFDMTGTEQIGVTVYVQAIGRWY